MQWTGICYNSAHTASDAKAIESLRLTIEVGHRIVLEHTMCLEKAIDLVEHLEPERPAQLAFCHPAGTKFLQHQSLKRAPLQITPLGGNPAGDIIGNRSPNRSRSDLAPVGSVALADANFRRGSFRESRKNRRRGRSKIKCHDRL